MSEATLEPRLREIVERLQPMRPHKILLFGSAARGDADELSDLDVIVVAEDVRPRFLDRIADAFDLLKPRYGIDLLIYTPEEYRQMLANENPLIEDAEREGRVLFERPAA